MMVTPVSKAYGFQHNTLGGIWLADGKLRRSAAVHEIHTQAIYIPPAILRKDFVLNYNAQL